MGKFTNKILLTLVTLPEILATRLVIHTIIDNAHSLWCE